MEGPLSMKNSVHVMHYHNIKGEKHMILSIGTEKKLDKNGHFPLFKIIKQHLDRPGR